MEFIVVIGSHWANNGLPGGRANEISCRPRDQGWLMRRREFIAGSARGGVAGGGAGAAAKDACYWLAAPGFARLHKGRSL